MSDGVLTQTDFSGGVFRNAEGQMAPENTVWDCVNGLLDDPPGIRKRGGCEWLTTSDVTVGIVGLADTVTRVGPRTLYWNYAGTLQGVDPTSAATASLGVTVQNLSRVAGMGDFIVLPSPLVVSGDPSVILYAGATRASAAGTAGTITLTNGSVTVTGSGTSFTGADAGSILVSTQTQGSAVLSIESNTQLTLAAPYLGPTASGQTYSLAAAVRHTPAGPSKMASFSKLLLASVGSPPRLVLGYGNRVHFSNIVTAGALPNFDSTDFHQLPADADIVGLESVGWDLLVFTTRGLYVIQNMAYDLTDDLGNPQQRLDIVNRDLILLGDQGIAGFRGSVVAPCVDDVYLVTRDGAAQPISAAIRPLYREYVGAGLGLGQATVHRGHYFLPFLVSDFSPPAWYDTLVCRLDGEQPAWSRWDGLAGQCRAFVQRVGTAVTEPRLFAAADRGTGNVHADRVVDCSQCFDPSDDPADGTASEADGSTHDLYVALRDYAAASQTAVTWTDIRLRYELSGGSLTIQHSDARNKSFVVAGSLLPSPPAQPPKIRFRRRAQAIHLDITSVGEATRTVIRSVQVGLRQRGLS